MNSATSIHHATLRIECRSRHREGGSDLYFMAVPRVADEAAAHAEDAWHALAAWLSDHDAALLEERAFLSAAALPAARAARARALADRDDGVPPAWLTVPAGETGDFAALCAHAVAGGARPRILRRNGMPRGRQWTYDGFSCVAGICLSDGAGEPAAAARGWLAGADELLAAAGLEWSAVARTWFWLRDILRWYGDFNGVRNDFYRARGLLRADGGHALPASTGIGIAPADGAPGAMEFVAESGAAPIARLLRAGRQNPASAYGSAFSRAAVSVTPFGRRIHVSGTASIGADGRTLHAGDPRAQIAETLRCVRAALAEAGASVKDVAQTLVYCRTPEVEHVFRREFAGAPFEGPVLRADICRDDLLFEVECLAIVP